MRYCPALQCLSQPTALCCCCHCHFTICLHLAAAAAAAGDELPTGQLTSLAAAHPEAYSDFIDCFLRSPMMTAADMVAAGQMMQHAIAAVLESDVCTGNSVAVAGLASAVTSLIKRAVQFIRDACSMQQEQQQLPAEPSQLAAACYPPAVLVLVQSTLGEFARGVLRAAIRSTKPAIHGSSNTHQAAASAALLAVLLARSLVQLADAMEAAGHQLLVDCQRSLPSFNLMWLPGGQVYGRELAATGSALQRNVWSQWQYWQLAVLHALHPVMSAMAILGMSQQAGDAEDRAAAAAAGPDVTASCSSSSSSQPKWCHLLHLRQFSPDWATAVDAFSAKRPHWGQHVEEALGLLLAGTPILVEGMQLLLNDALQLTRELVDAAPLPVVCNNPGCESLAGVSEAAACCKACSECKCRYCSVACQRADWKRHKHACKRMAAAAGKTCA
jgi:hypothetical protein